MKITCRPSGYLQVNTYIVWDEESHKGFIVDPGGYDESTAEFIRNNDISLQYIILTHGHGDHIGGVEQYMSVFSGLKLVASAAEADFLADPKMNETKSLCFKEIKLYADINVKDGDSLNVGAINLKFIETPGHTPGGMSILADDVLFSGDTLFRFSVGRTDFPGGSFEDLVSSIQNKLFLLPDETRVLPGHMGETRIGDEKRANPFVCLR